MFLPRPALFLLHHRNLAWKRPTLPSRGVLHWLDENFEKMFLVTGLLSITLFITWQVIYRYIITQFIERAGAAVWTEELSRYIFIWISYLALSVAIKKRSSIRVDMLYDHLPPRLQQISWIVVEVLFFILTATIAYYAGARSNGCRNTRSIPRPCASPSSSLSDPPFGSGLHGVSACSSLSTSRSRFAGWWIP